MWRYRDLLPCDEPRAGLNSGWTPLKRARNLEKHLGVKELYIKDDSANYPTWSYKERVVSVAITKAIELGYDTVGCASTGNLANSVAAHAAQAGLKAFVMIPHDLEQGKVLGSLIFGPTMVRIQGNYDDVNRLCSEIADKYGWAIVNVNLRPFYTEGAKTFGFEIAQQFGWKLPKHTVVPTAGGTIFPKIYKAYKELIEIGLVKDTGAKIYSAQAAGCNPVVTAIHKGSDIAAFVAVATAVRRALAEHAGVTVRAVVPLRQLPKTTSGKLQRFALADAYARGEYAAVLAEMAALAETTRGARDDGAVEHALLEICQALLPNRRLAADDNLFEIGTSSLTLAQIYERVDATWPGLLEVTDFFDYPTVRAMAGYLEQRTAGKGQVAQAHA